MKIKALIIMLLTVGVSNILAQEAGNTNAHFTKTDSLNVLDTNKTTKSTYNANTGYYYPQKRHLLLEIGVGTLCGTLGTMTLGALLHPNKVVNTNGEISDVYQPFDMAAVYCTVSALTVYAVGRSLKTKGSIVWTVGLANAMPAGIMTYGYIIGKPNDYRPAVFISSFFAPLMATIAYNVTAVSQSKKNMRHSQRTSCNTYISWKADFKKESSRPYFIFQYNF